VGPTVVLSAFDVLQYPQGGGHFSAFLQYVHGLRAQGADVWWLEELASSSDAESDRRTAAELSARLGAAGLPDRLIAYSGRRLEERRWLTGSAAEAETVIARAELLLNFHYEIDSELLAMFPRTALVDIDPGLLELWIAGRHLNVPAHDLYFTTGDTVGTPEAMFPSCGFDWIHIRPPVSIEQWPYAREEPADVFTTVSSWSSDEWVPEASGEEWYANSKRASFLEYLSLPRLAKAPLELALSIDESEREDVALLERDGWRVRTAADVTATPAAYRAYVKGSAGEFSCAKPSCMRLRNAWVSDRTVCYLASGRPAVVQDTGPSESLDGGRGVLRFSTLEQAAEALGSIRADYEGHRSAAREVAETYFDARDVARRILDAAFGEGPARRALAADPVALPDGQSPGSPVRTPAAEPTTTRDQQ
jgi:hypothetical protein